MKRETLFQSLGLGLAALLLAASLYNGACRAECNDMAARDAAACRELRAENRRLLVRCAWAESLSEIEKDATELGMQPISAEQIVSAAPRVG